MGSTHTQSERIVVDTRPVLTDPRLIGQVVIYGELTSFQYRTGEYAVQ